ncbi:MAG: zinc-binding dehydrogenase [Solirubrobacteraceae bacterium]
MRAARIHQLGGPQQLVVEEIAQPAPGPHDLLVRVLATSVNHRDIWMRKGHPHPAYRVDLPAILGIDMCAQVVQVGDRVDRFAAGERITISPYMPCGQCEPCRRARPQYCPRFDVYHGAYAELALVPAALALHVSPHVPVEQVGCFSNNYITAWQMLVGKAHIGPDDVVFVWAGTSGLGSAAIQIAQLVGATVIASAGGERKRAALRKLSPHLVVDHHSEDVVARVAEFTRRRGASIVFEHVGAATWERSLQLCAPGGAIVSAGATAGDDARLNITAMFAKQVRILGSRLGTIDDALAAVRQLEAGRLQPLIDRVLPLDRIADAHRLLEDGAVCGKVAVRVASP